MIIKITQEQFEAIEKIAADAENYIKDFFEMHHLFESGGVPLDLPDGGVDIDLHMNEEQAKIAYRGFVNRVEIAKNEPDIREKQQEWPIY